MTRRRTKPAFHEADVPVREEGVEHRAQVPVECPVCHWRHFLEVDADLGDFAVAPEIRFHLEAWLASRCPEHLGPIMEMSKN